MEFILAAETHLEDLCRITDEAKAQLKGLGLDQWQKGYPSREIWEQDFVNQTGNLFFGQIDCFFRKLFF